MNKRIFVAVNLPEEVKNGIYETLSKKIPSGKCKVVVRENLHITMLFLGYWAEEKIPELEKKLKKVGFEKFKIKLQSVGHFKGRVIWLGVGKGEEKLNALSKKLNEILEVKDERFHAHVTLARNKELGRKETDEMLKKLGAENYNGEIEVKGIEIMESILSVKGPTYKKLFSVTFK